MNSSSKKITPMTRTVGSIGLVLILCFNFIRLLAQDVCFGYKCGSYDAIWCSMICLRIVFTLILNDTASMSL